MSKTKHTPGPWFWSVNEKSKSIQITAMDGMGTTVMDFQRWGMQHATPRFNDKSAGGEVSLMKCAIDYSSPILGREHHAEWFKGLNHPDAQLMIAAPDLLEALKYAKRFLKSDDVDMAFIDSAIAKAEGR